MLKLERGQVTFVKQIKRHFHLYRKFTETALNTNKVGFVKFKIDSHKDILKF